MVAPCSQKCYTGNRASKRGIMNLREKYETIDHRKHICGSTCGIYVLEIKYTRSVGFYTTLAQIYRVYIGAICREFVRRCTFFCLFVFFLFVCPSVCLCV